MNRATRSVALALGFAFGLAAHAPPAAASSSVPALTRPVPRRLPSFANAARVAGSYGPVNGSAMRLAVHRQVTDFHRGDFHEFAAKRYGAIGPKALSRLEAIDPRYTELIADPGIVTYLRDFEKFAATYPRGSAGPWEIREAFSRHLGDTTQYRSMALTTSEYERILHGGIQANVVRGTNSRGELSGPHHDHALRSGLEDDLTTLAHKRVSGNNTFGDEPDPGFADPFISVAGHSQIAVSAGANFVDLYPEGGRQLYLFKLRVPKLDVVYRKKNGAMVPFEDATQFMVWWTKANGEQRERTWPFGSRTVESFVMYDIAPNEIVSSKVVSNPTARYHVDVKWPLWSKIALKGRREEVRSLLAGLKGEMDKATPVTSARVAELTAKLDEVEKMVKLRVAPPGLRGAPNLYAQERDAITELWNTTALRGFDDKTKHDLNAYLEKVREAHRLPGPGQWFIPEDAH